MSVELTDSLRREYTDLFNTCEIRPTKLSIVDGTATAIAANRSRYESVGNGLGIPWFFIGVVHSMEASLSFTKHLHCGDPLTARTIHVPKGRPLNGEPPFTWEASATDALQLEHIDKVEEWSLASVLFHLEKYNGFGYRTKHPEVLSPYLWSFSNHYTSGKYVADGTFDPDAVSGQSGAATLLRRMAEKGAIPFDVNGQPMSAAEATPVTAVENAIPLVLYSETQRSQAAKDLQRALNQLPGIFLLADGIPGQHTSDAVFKLTGHFLRGDPRAV